MYKREQSKFGIPLKELNDMKEGKHKAMTYEEKYKQHNQLMEYAETFTTQVKHDLNIPFDTNIIPIIFIDEPSNHFAGFDENGVPHQIGGGVTLDYRNQSVMKIFDCANHSIDELEQTIRHECIHYILWTLGLKNKDNTAIFHLLCKKYSAAADEPMSTEEQELYDKYQCIEISRLIHDLMRNRQAEILNGIKNQFSKE